MATTHIDIKLKITEGIGIGKTLADIARKYKTSLANIKKQVAAGMLVEAEHSSNPKKQQLTVMNHLWELGPKYYPELKKMEKKLEKGLKGVDRRFEFCAAMRKELLSGAKHNKTSVEKIAATYGITSQNIAKEMTELAIVLTARDIVAENISNVQKYEKIVELYYNQVNLSHRTSQSMLLQQYSTPVPISFIASLYVYSPQFGSVKRGGRFTKNHFSVPKTVSQSTISKPKYFEPSAGNGLLTIAIPYEYLTVNELDDVRLQNLQHQNFDKILNKDASQPFSEFYKMFDGIITNPPFGSLENAEMYDNFAIKTLDHLMALRALDTMKDNGRAAIIIGGHTEWDEMGRVQAGKNRIFFNYLYSRYNVEDVILIDGHKLYSRQGTAFNTRLILINGRKDKVEGFAPLKTDLQAEIMKDFTSLWNRVFSGSAINKTCDETHEHEQKDYYFINNVKYVKEKDCQYYPEGSDKKFARPSFSFNEIKNMLENGVAKEEIENNDKEKRIRIARARAIAEIELLKLI